MLKVLALGVVREYRLLFLLELVQVVLLIRQSRIAIELQLCIRYLFASGISFVSGGKGSLSRRCFLGKRVD